MDEVAVVAEEVAGAVRVRPDDRDRAEVGPQRQDAVVLEQDDRSPGQLAGQAASSASRRRASRGCRVVDVGLLEEPQAELRRAGPVDGAVDDSGIDPAVGERPAAAASP